MAERRFYIRGEIDLATAPALRASLTDALADDDTDLLIDCSDLTFIDSKGISVLIETQRALQAQGRSLCLVNANAVTARVVSVMGLDQVLRVNELADSGGAASHGA